MKKVLKVLWERHHFIIPPKYWKRYLSKIIRIILKKKEYLNPFITKEYNEWITEKEIENSANFKYNPLISFIIPVYNIEPIYLKDCLDSIINQNYKNFEICLADDHSNKVETINTLKEYEEKDNRVKVVYRKVNGHISAATNSALEIAKGEYIALMDDDDILKENALYEIVKALNSNPKIDMIYTDEDKIDMQQNRCEPHFKTDFAVDSFFGGNYICHFTVIKKTIIDKIGNFNHEYVGAQDFDLFLRATEIAEKVYHISKVLYHWRKVPGSTADTIENKEYAIENGKKAVEASLKRRNLDGYVTVPIKCTHYVVHYNYKKEPLVTIIMLDNNNKTIDNNLKELFEKTNYKNVEIIVSSVSDYKSSNKKVIITKDEKINSLIKTAKGEHILIIRGKIKVNDSDWIKELVGYSMQKEIGVVAPKIYNFDKTIKSAGLILSDEKIYTDAFANYFTDSTGVYGRLLVPYNYSALSSNCIMFSKQKYEKINGFIDNISFDMSNIDFCLKMISNNYRNVLLSHISIKQKSVIKNNIKLEQDKNVIRKLWDLDNDKYYNPNISKIYPFMLDKKNK